jgi:hypothetical protein
MHKKAIYVDFDGVIHQYDSKFTRIDQINDGPVDGAIEWLNALLDDDRFTVALFTTRNNKPEGTAAVKSWMIEHGVVGVEKIRFVREKPNYYLLIDDRAFAFEGRFPSLDEMSGFKAWNKR